jgi:hypothetical protein
MFEQDAPVHERTEAVTDQVDPIHDYLWIHAIAAAYNLIDVESEYQGPVRIQ